MQLGVGSDDIFDLLEEDPSVQENEDTEEGGMSSIHGGGSFGSNPKHERIPSRVFATARSANPHAATDTPTSLKYTSSNASKRSYGLKDYCYVVFHRNKGKSVLFLFKDGPASRVDDPFFDKYLVPELKMGSEEILFSSDWNLNVNDRTIDPRVFAKMLDHIVLNKDIMFASQILSAELMTYFLAVLMAVSMYMQFVIVICMFY